MMLLRTTLNLAQTGLRQQTEGEASPIFGWEAKRKKDQTIQKYQSLNIYQLGNTGTLLKEKEALTDKKKN